MILLLNRKCQELDGLIAYCQHAVGLGGVEIDGVTLFEHHRLTGKVPSCLRAPY